MDWQKSQQGNFTRNLLSPG